MIANQDALLSCAKAELDRNGVAIIPDVLSQERLDAVRQAILEAVEADRAAGKQLTGHGFDPDDRNIRLWDLILRGPVFRELVEHPLALALVGHCIGEDFNLSNFTGNITRPGGGRMYMHADQGFLPAPWPPYAMSVNIG